MEFPFVCAGLFGFSSRTHAIIAQLDRAVDYESTGSRFESGRKLYWVIASDFDSDSLGSIPNYPVGR